MDVYPYAKEHLYTSNLWNIILKHLSIKALTLDTSWHNFYKNYIDLCILLMYIPTQKNKLQLKGPLLYKHKMLAPGVEINKFLPLNIFLYFRYRSVCMYIFVTPPVLEILYMPTYVSYMPDYANLKSHDQFVALTDMKLHASNQLYTPICFWDKILKASLGFPGNVWPHPPKLTWLIYNFNRYEATCTKSTLDALLFLRS